MFVNNRFSTLRFKLEAAKVTMGWSNYWKSIQTYFHVAVFLMKHIFSAFSVIKPDLQKNHALKESLASLPRQPKLENI